MPEPQISNFECPHCGAKYKRVRIRAPSQNILPMCEFGETREEEMCCLECMKPVPTKDGNFLLKYLLVEYPKSKAEKFARK